MATNEVTAIALVPVSGQSFFSNRLPVDLRGGGNVVHRGQAGDGTQGPWTEKLLKVQPLVPRMARTSEMASRMYSRLSSHSTVTIGHKGVRAIQVSSVSSY